MAQGEGGGGHYADRMRQKKPKAKAVSAPAKSDDEIIESMILKPVKKRPPIPRAKPSVTADPAASVDRKAKPTIADYLKRRATSSYVVRKRKAGYESDPFYPDQTTADWTGPGADVAMTNRTKLRDLTGFGRTRNLFRLGRE
jgi:hypothetical protein